MYIDFYIHRMELIIMGINVLHSTNMEFIKIEWNRDLILIRYCSVILIVDI